MQQEWSYCLDTQLTRPGIQGNNQKTGYRADRDGMDLADMEEMTCLDGETVIQQLEVAEICRTLRTSPGVSTFERRGG